MDLEQQAPESFTMIIFYRGYHCPKCQEQLEELHKQCDRFTSIWVPVLALSMDSQERAKTTHDEWGIATSRLAMA